MGSRRECSGAARSSQRDIHRSSMTSFHGRVQYEIAEKSFERLWLLVAISMYGEIGTYSS